MRRCLKLQARAGGSRPVVRSLLTAGLAVLAVAPASWGAQCELPTLPPGVVPDFRVLWEDTNDLEHPRIFLWVHFANGACPVNGHLIPDARAWDMVNAMYDSYSRYHLDYGFRIPYVTTMPNLNTYVYDLKESDGTEQKFGEASAGCMRMDNLSYACGVGEPVIRQTIQHELFHTIQRHYMCDVGSGTCLGSLGPTFGGWVSEGTARYVQDKLFDDLDTGAGTIFLTQVNSSIQKPNESLFEKAYGACLFWSYLGEQFGTEPGEPELGIDFQRLFWEQIAANGSGDQEIAGLDALEDVLAALPLAGGRTLNDVWLDFVICNYAKDLDVSALENPQRYTYIDEGQEGQASYGSVPTITVAMGDGDCLDLPEYAASYFVSNITATSCQAVGFHGESYEEMGWALLGLSPASGGRFSTEHLATGRGREFVRSFISQPPDLLSRLAAAVTGLNDAGKFGYRFDIGPLSVDIRDPTGTTPLCAAQPGNTARFRAAVFVDGPEGLKPGPGSLDLGASNCGDLMPPPAGAAPRSIAGLRADDFTVKLQRLGETIPVTVHAATYVNGLWYLEAETTLAGNAGCYDLTVSLCPGVEDTEPQAVCFLDCQVHHVMVIDRSGSMGSHSKLLAAQDAGGAYVDAVHDDDMVGAVVFFGDRSVVCNDNTESWPLGMATFGHRESTCNFLEDQFAGGWTSIGDGLAKAQGLFPAGLARRVVLLVSDGMANESRWWDQTPPDEPPMCAGDCADAMCLVVPGRTCVDTITIGPHADGDLMQNIAEQAGGRTLPPVPVDEDGARRSLSSNNMTGADEPASITNRLTDSFLYGLQHFRGLERLFFKTGLIGPGTTSIDIPVTEAGVEKPTFFFNINDRSANLSVQLFDQNGNPVPSSTVSVYDRGAHVVYHLGTILPGTWRAELSVNSEVEYITGLLGRQLFGAQIHAAVSQVDPGRECTNPLMTYEGAYKQGVPVTILATLADSQGPIRNATVEATVIKPDGTRGCPPLFLRDDGTQGDGWPGDGVYGLIFSETWQSAEHGWDNDDTTNPPPSGVHGGTYHVLLRAGGESNYGETFQRWAQTSFHVFTHQCDTDGDGFPDSWERYYHSDPRTFNAAGEDPDEDGLTNAQEFQAGTHPFDPDTDDDGELDGSELDHGRCPTNGSDSPLARPADVEVVTDTGDEASDELRAGSLLLRFPWRATYSQMRIYRAVDVPEGFVLHHTVTPTVEDPIPVNYYDEAVHAGRQYYYRFQAVGPDGGLTRLSKIVAGVPVPTPGDWDGDGDVDIDDHALFELCASGPAVPLAPGCEEKDFDSDADVDQSDFAIFQRCLSGTDNPADPNCAD